MESSPCILKAKSPFEDTQNLHGRLSPRKRMRLPSFSNGATNITFQHHKVTRDERSAACGKHPGFRGCTIWFTGLSGAGKTTISFALEKTLIQLGIPAYGLDGDNVRHGLCKNLGFANEDRAENVRRVAEVAKILADTGYIALASFISPFKCDRQEARRIHEICGLKFFEIHVDTPLDVCEARDPKKLYKKARSGQLKGFTGIDSVYEMPENPDLILHAGNESEAQCVQNVLQFLYDKQLLPEKAMHQLCGPLVRELFTMNNENSADILENKVPLAKEIELSLVDLQWLQVLAEGWASPLSGFMRERQYLQCLHYGQILDLKRDFPNLNDSTSQKKFEKNDFLVTEEDAEKLENDEFHFFEPINQSIPIVLSITDEKRDELLKKEAGPVRLMYNTKLIALLHDAEIYPHRKEERIHRQFGYSDNRHPTIQMIRKQGHWLIGGDLEVLERIVYNDGLDEYRKTPLELRQHFADANCDAVFAFQLRNPIHNGHALLMRETREQLRKKFNNPMLLLHPLGGWTKDDDVPLPVRIAQHKAVIEAGVLEADWTVLAIFPSPMLYAGPTEVQWHARARLACGIHAYIVGRDPAGIANPETGDYLYDPHDGAKVLSMAPGLPHLEIIPFRVAAYDTKNNKMAFFDKNREKDFIFISGTKMRNYAKKQETPPVGFMVPKAWEVLANYYRQFAVKD